MRETGYVRPADAAEAIAILERDPHVRYLGGGTNLVDLMKLGVERPTQLVDVSRIVDAHVAPTADGGIRIGAAARNADVAANPLVRREFPAVAQAILAGASGQIRNVATIGGNLLQRTRCVYFQDVSKPCNKRVPGSGCPALDGMHRTLAILDWSDSCVATHPSDLVVALAACDATVLVRGAHGERTLPILELYRRPGDDPSADTTLHRSELVAAVELPPPLPLSLYRKVRDRASFAFALVSLAAALDLDEGVVRDVRIAFGGVAHRPWRALTAERMLRGQPLARSVLAAAADAELTQARPLRDNAFKVELVRSLLVSELERLAAV